MDDRLLEIRQRLGERLIGRLLEYQTKKEEVEAPVSEVSGYTTRAKKKSRRDRLGRVSYSRTYYYDRASQEGCSPLDEALGISEALSDGVRHVVRHVIVKLSVGRTFEEAAQVYEELMWVKIGTTTIWEKTQAAGMLARPALNPISTTTRAPQRPSTGMAILKVALGGQWH